MLPPCWVLSRLRLLSSLQASEVPGQALPTSSASQHSGTETFPVVISSRRALIGTPGVQFQSYFYPRFLVVVVTCWDKVAVQAPEAQPHEAGSPTPEKDAVLSLRQNLELTCKT